MLRSTRILIVMPLILVVGVSLYSGARAEGSGSAPSAVRCHRWTAGQ